MKTYGMNKATEFTKKQISVIYRLAKTGELKVEKWIIKELYDLADYYGYDDNRSVEKLEGYVLDILKQVFDNNTVEAQELINKFTEDYYSRLGNKQQNKVDRTCL